MQQSVLCTLAGQGSKNALSMWPIACPVAQLPCQQLLYYRFPRLPQKPMRILLLATMAQTGEQVDQILSRRMFESGKQQKCKHYTSCTCQYKGEGHMNDPHALCPCAVQRSLILLVLTVYILCCVGHFLRKSEKALTTEVFLRLLLCTSLSIWLRVNNKHQAAQHL